MFNKLPINEPELKTAAECILKHKLDWQVVSKSIYLDGNSPIDGYQAIIREDNGNVFQIAKDRYKIVQNKDAFSAFDAILGTIGAKYESAFAYKGGAIFGILARTSQWDFSVVRGDEIATYLRLTSSHDGSTPLKVSPFVMRLACTNGMTALEAIGTKRLSLKHTKNVKQRFLINGKNLFEQERRYFEQLREKFGQLAQRQMKEIEIDSFLSSLFNLSENEDDNSARVENQVSEVRRLIDNATGMDIPGVRGTAWGVYNAVTEYVDKYRSARGSDEAQQENREYAAIYGSGAALREKAFGLLVA